MLRKVFLRTLFLVFVGISTITFLCAIEIYNGTGLTHPLWDSNYDWMVLFRDILFISFVGGLLSTAAGIDNTEQRNFKKTATNGGYQYGHQINTL